jgi:hypothetical protein
LYKNARLGRWRACEKNPCFQPRAFNYFSSLSAEREVVDLKVSKIEHLKICLGDVSNRTPLCRTLYCFGCGIANLCLRDVLAIGKKNYTNKLTLHNDYLSFFLVLL